MTLAALGTLRDGVLHLHAALTARSLDGIPFREQRRRLQRFIERCARLVSPLL